MTIAIVLLPSSCDSLTSTVATQTVFGLSRLRSIAVVVTPLLTGGLLLPLWSGGSIPDVRLITPPSLAIGY